MRGERWTAGCGPRAPSDSGRRNGVPRSGPSLEPPSSEGDGPPGEREWEAGLELHPRERRADPRAGETEREKRGPEGAGPEPGKG